MSRNQLETITRPTRQHCVYSVERVQPLRRTHPIVVPHVSPSVPKAKARRGAQVEGGGGHINYKNPSRHILCHVIVCFRDVHCNSILTLNIKEGWLVSTQNETSTIDHLRVYFASFPGESPDPSVPLHCLPIDRDTSGAQILRLSPPPRSRYKKSSSGVIDPIARPHSSRDAIGRRRIAGRAYQG